jgi:putative transposase
MKGRYNGCSMNTFGYILPGAVRFYYQHKRSELVSKEAKSRLEWLDFYRSHGNNARLTCRHFGISPDTFYRWKRRFKKRDLSSLESSSRRPHHLRKPTTEPKVVDRIRFWREKYPRWGKEKIRVLLKSDGIKVSVSTIGRVLKRLLDRGVIREPLKLRQIRSRRRVNRPWARRKPREYNIEAPGDLVQVDTLDQEILPGLRRKQFTSRDYVSKFDVLWAFSNATSNCAKIFLDHIEQRMPFKVKAIQVDGGSEFMGEFEAECKNRGIHLFVLPPRSPKLNGSVERANRTHTEEFYQVHEINTDLRLHNRQLQQWEQTYNFVRPHQALGYLTPAEFYNRWISRQNGG